MFLESQFQSSLVKKIKSLFPNCIVLKNDPTYLQGFPDLLILCHDKWAALECKRSSTAKHQPNQDYYISKLNEMSYARFVSPENEEETVNELSRFFEETSS